MLLRVFLLSLIAVSAFAQSDDKPADAEEKKEPECEMGEWTTWSPCRPPHLYRHVQEDDAQLNEENKGTTEVEGPAAPPAPPPMDVTGGTNTRRRKRDLSGHTVTKRYASGPSRRQKRQAAGGGMTAHQMMGVIEKAKLQDWSNLQMCRKENTCPEKNVKPSCGPMNCTNGTAGPFPCNNIHMLGLISIAELGYDEPLLGDNRVMANDVWGWTDEEYGDEYVIIGLSGGTSFVRITDPLKPQVLGILYTRTKAIAWRDIKVVNNTAYIVSEAPDHGMQVFDLLQLRNKTGFHVLTESATYSKFGSAHNIVANPETGYVYPVGNNQQRWDEDHKYGDFQCNGGLHIIDVIEPLNPRFVGCFSEDGYTHDAQCVVYKGPHQKYVGKEVCFAFNEDTLTIVDVTEHNRPQMISRTEYRGSQYTHQGWLTEDQTMLLLDDELDERENIYDQHTKTHMWDVRDLEKPFFRATYESPVISIDHNQYVHRNYTWQSNYVSGLQVLYIDQDRYDLKPVGYFDVLPSGDGIKFEGTWSNYPFFKSGVVAVSSMEYGLFLLKPDYDAFAAVVAEDQGLRDPLKGNQWRMRSVLEAPEAAQCPASEERRACAVEIDPQTGVIID